VSGSTSARRPGAADREDLDRILGEAERCLKDLWMSRAVEEVRPAITDDRLRDRLHEYVRFRHLFRHGYGFSLDWAKLVPLLEGTRELAPELRHQLDGFIDAIESLSARLD
jgi:hypothetical protein